MLVCAGRLQSFFFDSESILAGFTDCSLVLNLNKCFGSMSHSSWWFSSELGGGGNSYLC